MIKNLIDKTQFTNLAIKFMLRKYKFLLWTFEGAVKLPRSYVLLDLRLEVDDKLQIRARVFIDVNFNDNDRACKSANSSAGWKSKTFLQHFYTRKHN